MKLTKTEANKVLHTITTKTGAITIHRTILGYGWRSTNGDIGSLPFPNSKDYDATVKDAEAQAEWENQQ